LVIFGCLMFNAATIMIARSIQLANATVAGLIEVCYPFFTIVATLVIFKENHLSLPVVFGGSLIVCGILVITFFGN
jgi:drug/metabolite transporter (DMT)-like permease